MNRKINAPQWRFLILALIPLGFGLGFAGVLMFGPDPPGAKFREYHLPGLTVYQRLSPTPALVVTSVQSGSQAEASHIMVGDEILAINGRPVTTLKDIDTIGLMPAENSLAVRLKHNVTVTETILIEESGHSRGT